MLKGNNIICISSIDWDFNWQGHQEIMSTLAREGNRVLFIENTGVRMPRLKDIPRLWVRFRNWRKGIMGIRKEGENLYILSPIALPFPFWRIARFINRYLFISSLRGWIKTMDFFDPVIWTFLPTGTAIEIIKSIESKAVVYYCIADFEELVSQPRKVRRAEEQLLKVCDVVFAQGEEIAGRCARLNKNVHIFPFGVSLSRFEEYRNNPSGTPPEDMKNIRKPVAGYVGALHKHFDYKLMEEVIAKNQDISFVFIGPQVEDVSGLKRFPNAFLLGEKKHAFLPAYIDSFDVCLIPYNISKYTNTVYPTKMNEYLIMGKPVVSVALPEVERFNGRHSGIVFLARNSSEFSSCIRKALAKKGPERVEKGIEAARENSWENRVVEMSSLIEAAIMQKEINREVRWRDLMFSFYHKARVRISRLLIPAALLYVLIFYTPAVWWLASPLKISEPPAKADAIVVFSGGVGESGKAGQGYEERVEYAVQLYKEGYARHLIFSSGYKYIFEEPMVMSALAVSLGVPEGAITLEEEASNTYENVKFTQKILSENGWSKVILISSPYHMRRAALVFDRIAAGVKVTYSPIPNSKFYMQPAGAKGIKIARRIAPWQIRGVLHEYLGIIYYWFKGYI